MNHSCGSREHRPGSWRLRARSIHLRGLVMAQQSDETRVRMVVDAWAQGITAKNTAAVIAQLAPDVVQFDLAPPLRVTDADTEGLESWFATWRDTIGYKISDLSVAVGADVA